jgi:hypothetical protein
VVDPVKIAAVRARAERDEIDRHTDETQRFKRAMTIWSEAVPIETTPAEVYLRIHRGVDLPDGVSGPVLRFHSACPFGDACHPGLIALVRNVITDEPQGIVRTALNPDGTAVKIDGKTLRKALGPVGGGAIKLTDNAELTTCLGVGEGVEGGRRARQARRGTKGEPLGWKSAWARLPDRDLNPSSAHGSVLTRSRSPAVTSARAIHCLKPHYSVAPSIAAMLTPSSGTAPKGPLPDLDPLLSLPAAKSYK